MKVSSPLLLAFALCVAGIVPAHATLYKWVAPDGTVSYSDTPPPSAATRVESKSLDTASQGNPDLPYALAEARRKHPVTLYTSRKCVPCDDGRALLSRRGIPFSEKTVASNGDIARLREVSGDAQLPVLVVGGTQHHGFEPGDWNTALTEAGYPETNRLPEGWRNPAPTSAAPAPEKAPGKPALNTAKARPGQPRDLPAPSGNAPPGFRF